MSQGLGNGNSFTAAANNSLFNLQRATNSPNYAIPPASSPATIPQNLFQNPNIQPTSVINLCNSSDVVIGPMTQYQGPVTIYQYMDATIESRSTQAGAGITQNRTCASTNISQKLSKNSTFLIVIITLVIIVTSIIVYVEVTRNKENSPKKSNFAFSETSNSEDFPNLGNGHFIIKRDQWGANEDSQFGQRVVPLKHPIPYVLITHIGVQSVPCVNIYKCSIKMRTIQDSARAEKNLPDIQGNFYVGDDGNIYVGRGWNFANTYANNTLAVTFMGDYARYTPSEKQIEATQYLLAHGVANNYLSQAYKLVAQNQTKSSKSPGVNVYAVIKNWPRFYKCNMEGNPPCGKELGMPEIWDGKM